VAAPSGFELGFTGSTLAKQTTRKVVEPVVEPVVEEAVEEAQPDEVSGWSDPVAAQE
jgi:hypothetical protein